MATASFRHQGFFSNGSPSHHIPMIAAVIKKRLIQNHRCLYFNSEQMVAELRSGLAEIGVNVSRETSKHSLVFVSSLGHLRDDQTFDVDRMIAGLGDALNQTLQDGYVGLWASGDIAWEFGDKGDFGQLRHYEMQLEEFMCAHAEMSGVCLYDATGLPLEAMQTGREVHPSFFISENESHLSPAYSSKRQLGPMATPEAILEVSFPDDILVRASAFAESQGITLDEFINQAITEKLYQAPAEHPNNGHF
jgi:MEDS: MEthanogen/methylotroph, DcmR Sensory domain